MPSKGRSRVGRVRQRRVVKPWVARTRAVRGRVAGRRRWRRCRGRAARPPDPRDGPVPPSRGSREGGVKVGIGHGLADLDRLDLAQRQRVEVEVVLYVPGCQPVEVLRPPTAVRPPGPAGATSGAAAAAMAAAPWESAGGPDRGCHAGGVSRRRQAGAPGPCRARPGGRAGGGRPGAGRTTPGRACRDRHADVVERPQQRARRILRSTDARAGSSSPPAVIQDFWTGANTSLDN